MGEGRGIVICGGGVPLFSTGLVVVKLLRQHGCNLPIEWCYADNGELPQDAINSLEAIDGVRCVNLDEVPAYKGINKRGFQIKPMAICASSFQEVLFIDSDDLPIRDPSYLFETPEYQKTGALIWKDFWQFKVGDCFTAPDKKVCLHRLLGIEAPEIGEFEFESGQLLINKAKHKKGMQMCLYMSLQSKDYHELSYGDKDCYALSFRATGEDYSLIEKSPGIVGKVSGNDEFEGYGMIQHDPAGRQTWIHMTIQAFDTKEGEWNAWVDSGAWVYIKHDPLCIGVRDQPNKAQALTDEIRRTQIIATDIWNEILNDYNAVFKTFNP